MTGWATHGHRRGNPRRRALRAFALAGTSALVLMLAPGEGRAEPVDWVGDALKEDPVTGADVPDDDWNNPDNWTPKKVPTGDDEVTVSVNGEPAGVMLDGGSASAGSLMVRGATTAGAALTIRNGALLTVDDGLGLIDLQSELVIGNSIFGTGGIAPGNVNAAYVDIASTGALIFDHNDTSGQYAFAPAIAGEGRVSVLSGWTELTGLNDYTGGTEIKARATLRGDSESLAGVIDGEAHDFGGTILASHLIIEGDGILTLGMAASGGVISMRSGEHVLSGGTSILADRLVINFANVLVEAGSTLGTGGPTFVASSRFEDGGAPVTRIVDSTVSYKPGSSMGFLSAVELTGASMLNLDLDNAGNSDNAVLRSLSGDVISTLDVAAGTTLNISRFNGEAGSFEGTLAGAGTINLGFGSGGTATWTAAPIDSTFSGTVNVDDMTLVAEDLGVDAQLLLSDRARAFVAGSVGSVATAGRLGIDQDGEPGTLEVTGNMVMDPLSVLTMNMGAPGGLPGFDSDLITVGGDLTLDGVLLVEDAGGFGFGLYRLFEYGGALTDNSLEIVGYPAGFSAFDFNVSTIHSGTVNLLVGDQGGGGEPPEIAMFPTDADTWEPDDFDPETTVIFAGEGRPIMVLGEIERDDGGIQFADDGFELVPVAGADGIIYLPGTDIPIHVGNGTAASADFTGTIGVDLTGLGGIIKTGFGTLNLTGNNSYTGGTTVEGGTLRGTTASLTGIIDFGSIEIEQRILSTTVIVTGGASQPLNIEALGGNYQLVDGVFEVPLDVPVVPDRLVIFDSTVTVGNGATFGTRPSVFAPGTTFVDGGLAGTELVDSTVNYAAGSTLSALGDWSLHGDSALTLGMESSAALRNVSLEPGSTFEVTKDTTVEIESLTGEAGSRVIVAEGGAIALNGDSTLDEIEGEGLLDVRGDVTLAGDSPDFSGDVEISPGGKLNLAGDFGSLELTEEQRLRIRTLLDFKTPGGEFAGVGRWFGEVLVDSSGAVSPGNSIGTLTVDSITFEPGSILNVEVDAAGNSDLLAVTGAATLNGGTVKVLAENGIDDGSSYAPETQYTILTAGGGVTGAFDAVTEDFAFLSAALAHGANAVTLMLTRDGLAGLCLAGASANQCATGEAVESVAAGALYNAVLVLSEPGALDAFDALSGEIHASAMTTLLEDSRFARDAAIAGLRGSFDAVGGAADGAGRRMSDRSSLWGQGFGSWGDWDGDANAAALDRSIGGFTMGGDTLAGDNVRLGLFGGYSHASFDADGRASSGSADSLHLGVYGGGQWDGFGLRLGGAYGWHEIEVDRSVAFTGFSDGLSADYDARTLQGFAEAGYRLEAGAVALEPFASLAHVSVRSDGFGETGGAAALTAVRQTVDTSFTTLGVRAETSPGSGGARLRLSGLAGWRHAFGDDPARIHRFASGGGGFAVVGAPLADDVAVIKAGVDLVLAPGATIGLGYSGQYGSGFTDQGAKARLAVRF